MRRDRWAAPLVGGAVVVAAWACGSSSTKPTTPTTPTAQTILPPANGPSVQIGYITRWTNSVELLGNIMDPVDGLVCGSQYCKAAVATGAACEQPALTCSCLAGLTLDVKKTAASGACSVAVTVANKEGLTGTTTISFDVAGSGSSKW